MTGRTVIKFRRFCAEVRDSAISQSGAFSAFGAAPMCALRCASVGVIGGISRTLFQRGQPAPRCCPPNISSGPTGQKTREV